MRLPGKALAASAVLAALLAPAAASADTVTTWPTAAPGSLRSAIAAGGAPSPSPPGLSGTILLAGQLEIDKNLTIAVPGRGADPSPASDATRVFHVLRYGRRGHDPRPDHP